MSTRNYGAGRSILIDKHGRIIAGNKTAEHAGSIGLEDVIVVKTDGTQLVAVQRTDLDLKTDKAAKELAIADNRTGQVSLDWDVTALQTLDVDLTQFWTEAEMQRMLNSHPDPIVSEETPASYAPPRFQIVIENLSEQQLSETMAMLGDKGLQCRPLLE